MELSSTVMRCSLGSTVIGLNEGNEMNFVIAEVVLITNVT